jgi:F420-dependent oxidoreductase-like protein
MQLSMTVPCAGDIRATTDLVVQLEAAGLDRVVVPEAYSMDAVSAIGYLAARTSRVEIGSGILNVFSRSPALLGMTAAGCDAVSQGRFFLGVGASGPQVVEGFHGIPYEKPLARTREVIEIVRQVLRREPVVHEGAVLTVPLAPGLGTGLGKPLKLINHPVRPSVPIWWASLMAKAVEATAEVADGWMPVFYLPERAKLVWGAALDAGLARRSPSLGRLQVLAGGPTAVGEHVQVELARAALRTQVALYVGGMGARGKNFYNTICRQYGWEREAEQVQDLYLEGRVKEAEAAVPDELVEGLHLCGPRGFVQERIAAHREAGVTSLLIEPVPGEDPIRTVAAMRALIDA